MQSTHIDKFFNFMLIKEEQKGCSGGRFFCCENLDSRLTYISLICMFSSVDLFVFCNRIMECLGPKCSYPRGYQCGRCHRELQYCSFECLIVAGDSHHCGKEKKTPVHIVEDAKEEEESSLAAKQDLMNLLMEKIETSPNAEEELAMLDEYVNGGPTAILPLQSLVQCKGTCKQCHKSRTVGTKCCQMYVL